MRRHWRALLAVLAAVLLALAVAGYIWLTDLPDPMPEARAALESDERVTVTSGPWLSFMPAEPSETAFVLYPGGRVPAEAYAPAARAIAEAGYPSFIVPMPFGLAVLSPDAADAVIEAHPDIEAWVIGGHSLGGSMAAQYADGHADIDGLALWAAYPAGGTDLREADLAATSIYATEDGLATVEEVEASADQLPPATEFVAIEGGNHAQFGWYGEQAGDGQATISRETQQGQVVAATLELLGRVAAGTAAGDGGLAGG